MITLTQSAIANIKKDRILKTKLMTVLGCSEKQLYNYFNSNSRRFTELDVINILVDYMQVPVSEIITGGKISKLLSK